MTLLRFYTVIAHTIIVVLNLNNLLSVTHAHQLKRILCQRQNFLRLFALQITFAGPGGKQFIFPLQLAIFGKNCNAYIQLAHRKMVGTFNIADNIIQITAEEDFPVNKILAAEIIDNAKKNQCRKNQLGLQIAD